MVKVNQKPLPLWLGLAILFVVSASLFPIGSAGHFSFREDATELSFASLMVEMDSECRMPPGSAEFESGATSNDEGIRGDIPAVRYVMDPYPAFNGLALDVENNQVVMSDANRKSLLMYERTGGARSAEETRPLRQIMGPQTQVGFIAGVTLDSVARQIYTVNNDIEDSLVVFSYDAEGNVKPDRSLVVPRGAWGVSLSRPRDEIAISVQELHAVLVYRREAKGLEAPVRSIRGPRTGMADPHGIVLDDVNNEIVVANHGQTSEGTSSFWTRRSGYEDLGSELERL